MDLDVSFRDKLDKQHIWPGDYLFKFVVPSEKSADFLAIFPHESFHSKKSSGGKYISHTLRKKMNSGDEVIAIYHAASKVEGIIAL